MKNIRSKSLAVMITMTLIVMTILSACSSGVKDSSPASDTPSNAGSTPSATSSESGSAGAKIKLHIMHHIINDDADALRKAYWNAVKKFEADNPSIELVQDVIPHDNYETKLKVVAAGNELPDIVLSKGTLLPNLYKNGQIMALDDVLADDSAWGGSFLDGSFSDFESDGKKLGVPMTMTLGHVLYWNKEIFKEAGITTFPEDLDQFKNAITKIKEKGYIPIALGNKGKWPAASNIFTTLAYRYIDDTWYNSLREYKGAKFTNPEFVKSLVYMQDLAKMGAFNKDMNSLENTQQRELYYNKKAAMFIEGSWSVSAVSTDAPKDVLDATEITMIPAQAGKKELANVGAGGGGWGFVVKSSLQGEKLDAAIKFLKAISSPEFATDIIYNGSLPAVKVAEYDQSKVNPFVTKFLEFNKNVHWSGVFDVQLPPQIVDAQYSGIQELLIGQVTPEALAKKLEQEHEASKGK